MKVYYNLPRVTMREAAAMAQEIERRGYDGIATAHSSTKSVLRANKSQPFALNLAKR